MYYHFWFTFLSFQGPQSWNLIILIFLEYNVSLFEEEWQELRQIMSVTGESLARFLNYSRLPNILILLSFFGSFCHCLKFHKVEIWVYQVFGVRGEVLWVNMYTFKSAIACYKGFPCKILIITQSYLIFLFYYHF